MNGEDIIAIVIDDNTSRRNDINIKNSVDEESIYNFYEWWKNKMKPSVILIFHTNNYDWEEEILEEQESISVGTRGTAMVLEVLSNGGRCLFFSGGSIKQRREFFLGLQNTYEEGKYFVFRQKIDDQEINIGPNDINFDKIPTGSIPEGFRIDSLLQKPTLYDFMKNIDPLDLILQTIIHKKDFTEELFTRLQTIAKGIIETKEPSIEDLLLGLRPSEEAKKNLTTMNNQLINFCQEISKIESLQSIQDQTNQREKILQSIGQAHQTYIEYKNLVEKILNNELFENHFFHRRNEINHDLLKNRFLNYVRADRLEEAFSPIMELWEDIEQYIRFWPEIEKEIIKLLEQDAQKSGFTFKPLYNIEKGKIVTIIQEINQRCHKFLTRNIALDEAKEIVNKANEIYKFLHDLGANPSNYIKEFE